MGQILDEVLQAASALEVNARASVQTTSSEVLKALSSKFTRSGSARPIWEHLENDFVVQSENGWRWVGAFEPEAPALLVFDPERESSCVEFLRAKDIPLVLGECTGFEVYVTDSERSYVLCFNHHNMLIAVGRAKSWLMAFEDQGLHLVEGPHESS